MCVITFLINNKDLIQSICSLATVLIAFSGFFIWKKQLKGSEQFRISHEILEQIYKVQNAFSVVRQPMVFANEFPENFQGIINLMEMTDNKRCNLPIIIVWLH